MMRYVPVFSIGLLLFIIGFCSEFSAAADVEAEDITPGELLIRLASNTPAAALADLHVQYRVESIRPLFPHLARPALNPKLKRIFLLRFAPDAPLSELRRVYEESPFVEAVAYNYLRPTLADPIIPNDPMYPEQWSLPLVQLPQAWAIEKGDRNVVIAVIDSGVDYRHEDLAAKVWINPGEVPENGLDDDGNGYVDDIHGWDFTDAPNVQAAGDYLEGDNEPIDESGHGTHVAGIAGAMPDNGIGIAGVAWECPVMVIRSGLTLGGRARLQDDDTAAAIIYAADNGANVINMSWGSERRSFVLQDTIDYAYARGAVLVGAAGNLQKPDAIFPAAYRKVIAVASTEQNRLRYYQSNFGASVDIGAPGNVILSTQIDNRYRLLTGTSMAAPHVAGVAALILSKRPALRHDEVRQILINTTDSVYVDSESAGLDRQFVGAGNLNAERALLASGALQARILSPETHSGGSDSITVIGTAGGYKFHSWQLSYGIGTVPGAFTVFTDPDSTQKVDETLAVWDTTQVPEGIYTLRLTATATDGQKTHDQVVLSVDRTPPQVFSITATDTLYGDRPLTIFTWATDDVTRNVLYYRRQGSLAPFASVETTDFAVEHAVLLGLTAGTYQFFIEAENATRLKTRMDNGGAFYTVDIVAGYIGSEGFTERSLEMPPLHLTNTTADFDRDGLLELVGTPLDSEALGQGTILAVYERGPNGRYELAHTLNNLAGYSEEFVPWGVDDTDNDGLLEVLATDDRRAFLIESLAPRGYPENVIWETPFLGGGRIVDVDGDGHKEIIGADNRNDRLLVFEYDTSAGTYLERAALHNDSAGSNVFAQQFAINDFDADGRVELVAADSEGDLFVYESTPTGNTFRLEWQTALPLKDISQLVAGDLTGDGRSEFVVGGALSLPDNPSAPPFWKFFVFTYTPSGYALLSEGEKPATTAIAPHQQSGNSLAIADLAGDRHNKLIVAAYPNLYVMEWNGAALAPLWHREIAETPALLTAELNANGFREFYVNLNDGVYQLESVLASGSATLQTLQPWNVTARPLTEQAVQVTWDVLQDDEVAARVFTVYRAEGEKTEPPASDAYQKVAEALSVPRFLDRGVTKDNTYWYTLTTQDGTGTETARTEPVSATPREPPQLLQASYYPPDGEPGSEDSGGLMPRNFWVRVTFDRRMAPGVGDRSRYLLRTAERIDGVSPVSAIRDQMGTRVLLAFDTDTLIEHFGDSLIGTTASYQITVSNVVDIDNNPIRAATRPLEIPSGGTGAAVSDLTQVRVYPNPVRPHLTDKGAVTFDRVPVGTRIHLFTAGGALLDVLDVTELDQNRKAWWLTSNNTGDVSTGVYVYVLEFGGEKRVGKIAVVK